MGNDSSTRIVESLRAWIAQAPPGARLPSGRELASEHGASPVTVQKAMHTLAALGLTESRPGVGTFVRATRSSRPLDFGWQTGALRSPHPRIPALSTPMRSGQPDAIALHAGYPDRDLLPERLVRAALARAARSDASVSRGPSIGSPELQAWFAAERVGAGQPLLLESPTYWGAIVAAAQAGVQVVPIPAGAAGVDPDDVARAFAETGARAIYAQPNFANPTGARWGRDRAERILDIVQRHGAFLVEDDWAHDFGIEAQAEPVAALDDAGHVIYLRSLTKSVSPALRVAAVIARGPARDRILADHGAESMYVSSTLQAAALDVVTQPAWRSHRRSMQQQLRTRRDLMATSLQEHAPEMFVDTLPTGGLNLWARLPDGTDLNALVRECEAQRLLLSPGNEWFPAEPPGPFVRLTYAGPDPARFAEAAQIIGTAMLRTR